MLASQKLTIELHENRARIRALHDKGDNASNEELAEIVKLDERNKAIESSELPAAIRAEAAAGDDDAEARELDSLAGRADMGQIFAAAIERRPNTDGETAELQQHAGLSANQVPISMLRGRDIQAAVTPAPANVGRNMQPIIPGVFPQSAAGFLGVDMPTVGVGESVFPVLKTNADVKVPAEGAAAAETTGAFDAEVLSPARLQASFFYSREDAAKFAGMGEALRMNLADALADGLDKQVIAGTSGLLSSNNLTANNAAAVTDFAGYRSRFVYDRIDGTFAAMASDVRVVMGSATYGHAASQYRGDHADFNALDALMRVTAGVRVSAHVPNVAANKQNAVVRRGVRRDMVAPIWEGVTLIPDEITKAATGEIVITAVMLYAVKILRAAGFAKVQAQHA